MRAFARARDFVYRNARLLEQRVFEAEFESSPGDGVVAALRGYRNADGGFGHGLEPDKRCPASQPLDVQFAFETMAGVGAFDADLARGSCDFLASVAGGGGLVPIVLPSIAAYPRAEHWRDGVFPPTPSPAATIAALMHEHGVAHTWVDEVTETLLDRLEERPPGDAHSLRDALLFLERVPDRGRAEQDDGGWPLSWTPPSPASELEWRGIETVTALRVLRAYGRSEAA